MGDGQTAQAAKHNAAGKALKMLRDIPIPDGKSKLDPTSQPFTPGIEYDDLKSPISLGLLQYHTLLFHSECLNSISIFFSKMHLKHVSFYIQ